MSVTESLTRWVPGIGVARSYRREWLPSDAVAGLVLAAILVPQGMAYAELAGLPPVTGLYTTIACLVGYAIFGPSRVLVLGPDSSISPLIFAAIVPLLVTDDPGRAVVLAGMLALLVGVIEIALGIGKLGFVADLLSSEVQIGYMNGLAVTIIVSQLPKLFGFSTDADGFGDEIREFVEHLDHDGGCRARRRRRGARRAAPPPADHTPDPRRAGGGRGCDDRLCRARASRTTGSRPSGHCRAASRARRSPGRRSTTSARCSSPPSASSSSRSPTPSPPRRPSPLDAATSWSRTRR